MTEKAVVNRGKGKAQPRRGEPNPLPHRAPAGTEFEEIKAIYDAEKNAEDVWYRIRFPDGHSEVWHSWLRDGIGWMGPEVLLTNKA